MYDFYRAEWHRVKTASPEGRSMERVVNAIADSFWDNYYQELAINPDYLELLCEIATFRKNPAVALYGSNVIFKKIIEELCDSFDEFDTETYRRVMAQIIDFCRKLPLAGQFDRKLSNFGMISAAALLERSRRLYTQRPRRFEGVHAKKVIILSRVTIGADIAITSIVVRKLMEVCTDAEFIIIGNAKLNELFGANRRIKIANLAYSKKEILIDKLMKWIDVLDIIEKESRGCKKEDIIVIDPDSRLSQLGILPCIEDNYYWNSRRILPSNGSPSFTADTNRWINCMIEDDTILEPTVWLKPQYKTEANERVGYLRQSGASKVIVVNFGVGGDTDKQVDVHFEQKVLSHILSIGNVAVLLDKGVSKEEASRADHLANQLGGRELPPIQNALSSDPFPGPGLYTVTTSIGQISGLIAAADGYIGYDSACQHIAAAVNTNCITIFVTKKSVRFVNRWSCYGTNFRYTVYVDGSKKEDQEYTDEALYRIANLVRSPKFIATT